MSDDESPVPSRVLTTPDPLTRPTREAGTDTPKADDGETQSPAMRELFVKAQRVARTELTILVTGETGAGKEWLARWLHAHSPRAFRKFVPVNCGAIPDTLLDTYLFGQTSGGFTGEVHESLGMFEAATGGTLFLDHVGDASPAMQVKLLGVLEAQQVQRVGEWRLSADQCSCCGGDQPQSRGRCGARPVSPGPVLPPARRRAAHPSAA